MILNRVTTGPNLVPRPSKQVTLLAVTLVSKEIRDWMDAHARSKDQERAEDAGRTHALVSALINELLVNASLSSVPLVLAAGCKLVGSFATLVGGGRYGRPRFGSVGGSAAATAAAFTAAAATVGGGGDGAGSVATGAVAATPAAAAAATATPTGGAGGLGGSSDPSLLPRALGYLTVGLQQAEARDRAAISVRTVAASCERAIVNNPAALEALLQVCAMCVWMFLLLHRLLVWRSFAASIVGLGFCRCRACYYGELRYLLFFLCCLI